MPVLSIGQFIRLNGIPSEHSRCWEGREGSLGLGTQRGAQPAAWGGGPGDTEAGVGALGRSLHGGRISAGRQPQDRMEPRVCLTKSVGTQPLRFLDVFSFITFATVAEMSGWD